MKKILDWNEYINKAVETVAEGIVMLRNVNGALPLDKNREVAVFGRIQLHYYKSGTGSGGMVNVTRVYGITDGLIERGARINTRLLDVYKKWEETNPYEQGEGWGNDLWSQKEMPLDDETAAEAARTSDTAIVVIGRTAGEEMDSSNKEGAYLLSALEEQMIAVVRKHFKKVVVLLNVGNIVDMSFVEKYSPDSVLYVWQGGMTGGLGTADVLLGNVSPSGKLPDTIAASAADFPSDRFFGDRDRNFYGEDIYVGYRWFETFAPEKVVYPFGFGLSYTEFEVSAIKADCTAERAELTVSVKNMGRYAGKEVVQVYASKPCGRLGQPAKELCAFAKTKTLMPGEKQELTLSVKMNDIASFDDSGVTGMKSCFVLEKGEYAFCVGTDVRNASKAGSVTLSEDICVKKCSQAIAPVLPFDRLENHDGKPVFAPAPLSETDEEKRIADALPAEIKQTGDRGIKLEAVKNGSASMEEFIAQLSDEELSCIVRGEGMGSPKVTAGTAAAFGGVSKSLTEKGIPCCCCSDGPSGMRLDCGTKAFSLPNGTLLASTFNTELLTELFAFTGREMTANRVECLLGPGMNIHRHPLNGRNFEYFSEDPFLTGMCAAAELKGLHSEGVTGTIKHFSGNNQETNRHFLDSAVSERAMREIYLKGFELAVKEGGARSIMTTYGSLNGLWTAGNYGLDTVILRDEWGFDGIVMTDWWANINRRGAAPDKTDLAAMVRAQNDLYMVCADSENHEDNTLSSLEKGTLTRGELQRCAMNICRFAMETHAMERLCGTADEIEIINREEDTEQAAQEEVIFYDLKGSLTIPLEDIPTTAGTAYAFALDVEDRGFYKMTLTGSSTASETAQMPVTLFSMGSPVLIATWNGTDGKEVSFSGESAFFSRFTTLRLYFAKSGLKLHRITFEKVDKDTSGLVM